MSVEELKFAKDFFNKLEQIQGYPSNSFSVLPLHFHMLS